MPADGSELTAATSTRKNSMTLRGQGPTRPPQQAPKTRVKHPNLVGSDALYAQGDIQMYTYFQSAVASPTRPVERLDEHARSP